MNDSEAGGASAQLGRKNLTTIHAVAQALAIGPMFSVALVLGGVSRPDIGAGWNATLAVLLAGIGVTAIAYTVSLYARRYAGAGAVYEYLTHGAHPWVGVFTAGFFFVGALFLGGGGIYLGLGILGDGFWKAHISSSGPAWWVWGLIALGIVLVLNYIGVRIAIRAMLAFAALSFVAMARITSAASGSTGANLPAQRNWVDLAGKRDVALVSGGTHRVAVLETAYHNVSISRLYYVCQPAFEPDFGEMPLSIATGGRLSLRARYVVAPISFSVRGRVLARNRRGGLELVAPPRGVVVVSRPRIGC